MKVILIRGLPGSGKSTKAVNMCAKNPNLLHYEADMYFVDPTTHEYKFNPNEIEQAHKWCQERVLEALKNGRDVVVTNTFVKKWELEPYEKLAKKFGAIVEIHTLKTQYKNIHNVPEQTIERMKKNWEELL